MAERNAAQVPTQQPQQQIVDAAVEDVTELASEVVDTATGEVLNAQPAAHREQPKKPQVKTSGTPCPL
jgi:hypothetical protein